MQFTTSEKDTISLNKLYFSNYTILTSGFNVIFDGKIPDGVIINNDLMLIIESKKYIQQDDKQLFQIKGYVSSIKQIYPSVKIKCSAIGCKRAARTHRNSLNIGL